MKQTAWKVYDAWKDVVVWTAERVGSLAYRVSDVGAKIFKLFVRTPWDVLHWVANRFKKEENRVATKWLFKRWAEVVGAAASVVKPLNPMQKGNEIFKKSQTDFRTTVWSAAKQSSEKWFVWKIVGWTGNLIKDLFRGKEPYKGQAAASA